MIEIKTDIKQDDIKIGELEIELSPIEFEEFINEIVKFKKTMQRTGYIKIVDSNGNYDNNFTIPSWE